MDFSKQLKIYTDLINDELKALIDGKNGKIYDAMRYSLYAGGKRIRPVITLAAADVLGGDRKAALLFGCALEMIHTYSLIHDDLPCMDNDELRRGKPTNHAVFGEATAVLAGDALLNFACECIVNGNIEPHMALKSLKILYNASGAEGMISGQVLDMEAENVPVDKETLTLLHNKKTGALINAAGALGAISAGKDENLFYEFTSSIGLAFQIRDDILDVIGNEKDFGKPINSDTKNNKTTFVTLYSLEGAKEILNRETEKAIKSLECFGEKGEFLKQLSKYLLNRQN
ncbi:MAG: farnesyl diphosphate synthase [Clostridia bacterium]|nr:farnesyl diphosphate synthase [Clostridia bacterium]